MELYKIGSDDLCHETNPTLWEIFCTITNRPPEAISFYWTEQDVATWLIRKAKKNDDGRTA